MSAPPPGSGNYMQQQPHQPHHQFYPVQVKIIAGFVLKGPCWAQNPGPSPQMENWRGEVIFSVIVYHSKPCYV